MMDPDKQIVRTHDDFSTNLAVGEPFFLRGALENLVKPSAFNESAVFESYPPYMGDQRLLGQLKRRFSGHVVVTNGAKQALLASLYALKQKYPQMCEVAHRLPFWPSYPTLAAFSDLFFRSSDLDRNRDSSNDTCYINTSPNNPDGSQTPAFCHIWDAAYAHKMYGWNGERPLHDISVWSAAKLFGISGLRIGWLVTDSMQLAEAAANYVEKTTSGVNVEAQHRLANILAQAESPSYTERWSRARLQLVKNAVSFRKFVKPHCEMVEGVPAKNGAGMFAWFKAKKPALFKAALKEANITVVDGAACGMVDTGWFRMSMGHYPEVTADGLKLLQEKLNG